nr:peptidase M50 [Mycolicibacterium sediminis]
MEVHDVTAPTDVDAPSAGRLIVVGGDGDLATVLTRLLRTERLDVEVAYVPRRRTAATRAYGLPTGTRAVRAARTGTATTLPLIRDDTGRVLVGVGLWVGETGDLRGEAVVDDTTLFDGTVAAVRIEPTGTMPGLRAAVAPGRLRPRRWISGRAAQLGSPGAVVVRDGEPAPRALRRSTFYRHVTGWAAVR